MEIDLKGLKKLGYAVIDLKDENYDANKDIYQFVVVESNKSIYSKKIKELLGIGLKEELAIDMTEEIYKHKWIESEKARRDIGMKKAAKDWYDNHYEEWKKSKEGV